MTIRKAMSVARPPEIAFRVFTEQIGSWWPVACYAAFLAACTAFAIWCGPETYEESITVDNTTDGVAMRAAAMPARA